MAQQKEDRPADKTLLTTPSASLDEATQRYLAFQVAEQARERLFTWSKWIGGVAAVLLALVGIPAYIDFRAATNSINGKIDERIEKERIEEKINTKVEAGIKNKTDEMERFKARLQDQYVESLVLTKTKSEEEIQKIRKESEKSIKDVRLAAERASKEIESHKKILYLFSASSLLPPGWSLNWRSCVAGLLLD